MKCSSLSLLDFGCFQMKVFSSDTKLNRQMAISNNLFIANFELKIIKYWNNRRQPERFRKSHWNYNFAVGGSAQWRGYL